MKFLSCKQSVETPLTADRSAQHPTGVIGLVDANEETVTPLLFPNYRPVSNLHHLIEEWDNVSDKLLPGTPREKLSEVEILAPLRGRDVLCVGKNYKEHAAEFHNSGYDSSDKQAQPEFPVIFTKRSSSIVGTGTPIYPHPGVTESLDYEGELGIIVGKAGFKIPKEKGYEHVWGCTIINDMTARERQRDHKQFYIGKSLDTFCPMGPYATHASAVDFKKMMLETKVNGETRQKQHTAELIFDIPTLIATCSMGITLQPGDVIATGTPAGVCLSSGVFLKPGDKIDVTITGLGTLSNTIGSKDQPPPKCEAVRSSNGIAVWSPDANLFRVPSGPLHIEVTGKTDTRAPTIIFVHGLGGSSANYAPLIASSGVAEKYRVVTFDLEGHGLSPLTGNGLSVAGFADSVKDVLNHVGAQEAIVVAHSMGGIIATTFAATNSSMVSKLFLIGPVKAFPEAGFQALTGRAETVRKGGMPAVATTVATVGTASSVQRPLAKGYVLSSLLATPAEGYAQACIALATAIDPDYSKITGSTLILAGDEDKTAPKATIDFLTERIKGSKVVTCKQTGHWIMLENEQTVSETLKGFV